MKDSEYMMWVCPRCGAIRCGDEQIACQYCGTLTVKTDTSFDEYGDLGDDGIPEWERMALEKYAPHRNKAAVNKREILEAEEELQKAYIPRCPTCGCPKIRYLTGQENTAVLGGGLPDRFTRTTGKTFICLNCGYTW